MTLTSFMWYHMINSGFRYIMKISGLFLGVEYSTLPIYPYSNNIVFAKTMEYDKMLSHGKA